MCHCRLFHGTVTQLIGTLSRYSVNHDRMSLTCHCFIFSTKFFMLTYQINTRSKLQAHRTENIYVRNILAQNHRFITACPLRKSQTPASYLRLISSLFPHRCLALPSSVFFRIPNLNFVHILTHLKCVTLSDHIRLLYFFFQIRYDDYYKYILQHSTLCNILNLHVTSFSVSNVSLNSYSRRPAVLCSSV